MDLIGQDLVGNTAVLIGAEFNAELERGRAIASGRNEHSVSARSLGA
jgi:hypothetical protein